MNSRVCVFQDWIFNVNMQQQSVLIQALRGPDGFAKYHPCKTLVRHYRATILKAAHYGRPLRAEDPEPPTFMSISQFAKYRQWYPVLTDYFQHVDELPMHYHMHMIHAAQIVAYKHPDATMRNRWLEFYGKACDEMHLPMESEAVMDQRLADWERAHWDDYDQAWINNSPDESWMKK
jgi:hypothetical protein